MRIYRITFDTIPPSYAATIEARYGKDCWQHIDFDTLPWSRITNEGGPDLLGQYRQLRYWEQTHFQPIRNVKLDEQVVAPVWKPVAEVSN